MPIGKWWTSGAGHTDLQLVYIYTMVDLQLLDACSSEATSIQTMIYSI